MTKKEIRALHTVFIIGGWLLLIIMCLLVYILEKYRGLQLLHGQIGVIVIGISYVYIIRHIEKNILDTKIAYHNYITMFARVKGIHDLSNQEIIKALEVLYPKKRPYKSSIAHVYFENGIMYRARKSDLSKYKPLCMANFEHQVDRYKHMTERL